MMEGRSPTVSRLTFTHREADEKKFPVLCRSTPRANDCRRLMVLFENSPEL